MNVYKKNIVTLLLLAGLLPLWGQQTPSFSQFVLNQYALNPAVAGTNIGLEAVGGTRVQWVGMPGAPVTNFGSVTYGWRKNFSYRGHHGIGFYAEDDRQGMFSSKAAYVSYAYHLRIFTGLHIGAGIFAGVRSMGLNYILHDVNDPALDYPKFYGLLYPDVIPGIRLYTKKFFFDASVRQVYVNRIKQGNFQLGTHGVRLDPTLICSVKRKFTLGDNTWVFVPALLAQYNIRNTPFLQGNFMLYYHNKLGVGASVRGNSFASAILQVRFLKNVVAGVAYDYSIDRLRAAAANSYEIVLTFTPGGGSDSENKPRFNVAQCPDFDF